MNKKGMSLLEVFIAGFILVLGIIPLIRNSQADAEKAIETEKIQMAERILESIKSELMTMKFGVFYDRAKSESLDEKAIGPFPLNDGYYPSSYSKVVEVQQKYKDFEVVGTWSWAIKDEEKQEPDKTMVRAEIMCSFTRSGKDKKPLERRKAFLIVRP
ncbi:MAG: hypothetical protein IKO19_09560 [Candidatus Riflebacteria bacterium]|nr:hypothetical protein [Candidatus Riflebacteria bacterium]